MLVENKTTEFRENISAKPSRIQLLHLQIGSGGTLYIGVNDDGTACGVEVVLMIPCASN